MSPNRSNPVRRYRRTAASLALLTAAPLAMVALMPQAAVAAKSSGCTGGGFRVLGKSAAAGFTGTVAAPAGVFSVVGRYNTFQVRPSDFAVFNWAFTGAANPNDITNNQHITVFASKVPQTRGLRLTSRITVQVSGTGLTIARSGPGFSMKIQAQDCATGGIFQMEPERADGTRTRIVHRLAAGAFYFDNANFRARLGQFLGADCTSVTTGPPSKFCVKVTPRVNITATAAKPTPQFSARDSAQVATRVPQPECGPDFTNNLGLAETKDQCGGMSIWDVASGGRMGLVTGEDSTEVANPPSNCTHQCKAQDQVRGRLAVLGFRIGNGRLTPRTSTQGLNAPLTP